MTIEDLPDFPLEGNSLIGRYPFLFQSSDTPVIFSISAAPMPSDCEFSFFDPNDTSCQEILFDPKTSVSELFAILRQWVPQVQQNIDVIGNEILKRGCNVNDRDGLTDMTLLHYTCKSGAHGIGDVDTAVKFATQLIDLGADVSLRSRWTNMNALHYAAYFDVPELIRVILKTSKPKDVDATCSDFNFGTALHIAAYNLCAGTVKCLLEHGANPAFRNDKGQIPADVVPDPVEMPLEMADAAATAKEVKQMLLDAVPLSCDLSKPLLPNYDRATSKAMLTSLGLKLGDRVVIAGQKVGTLRFCGTTEFASGQWAGIELDEPEGKNNGSVGKVQYFKCTPKYGIFAPLSKISKAKDRRKNIAHTPSTKAVPLIRSQKVDVAHVTSKVNTGLMTSKKDSASESTLSLPPGEELKTGAEKDVTLLGSVSSSSSISSLEHRQSHSKKLSARGNNKKTVSKSPSVSSRASAGLNSSATSVANNAGCEGELRLGDRVLVVGQRIGTIKFFGTTNFAPGYWYGIELDKPHGKNDGSVGGVQYFSCSPRYGIFAPPSRVQRVTDSLDTLSEISSNKQNHSYPGFRRSFSTTSASSQKEINRRNAFAKSKPALRRSWSGSTTAGGLEGRVRLREGSQVLLTSSSEVGTVRYVGPADFASGIWLGLELRSAKGRNDGSVGEKRYFTCKPNHGVLVRPSRVTYRGINGSKLVDENC
ncbi:CAP-Gly domain-containing linker protein 4 isoform X1 [Hippopotamus amphibius kiboko]|uniref:CAP-Gly domain-containing linker protein 4 isoform X1 n=1 Tax=Hippopotamus amphibius kiboko TaxID=575201 RepID=UPI0025943048|nr:CAP-Gly domain-containing linker protein 4 isoform X1 [Hippopotamus amphibius kiboko]XP_057598284.1 CAP-Gly domain-containing linker protein 4 isoform X1 [Hippopotamus amphibius kiboko]XP_057598286.1 CAP-Gly domain-containing linker protein 4 isoform X1 [Hippopotamus amphibius kiboko]XP_057598287.1 CAP-Gly domain-containing linker protein 4 isoform X1 [Hippopotamus amphibius kiboko]XP_057598288.1 CAP-Gly domain-containing linker protein 4 isoform X1 [Hippopotamus amphibius kiboko]XP_0575982